MSVVSSARMEGWWFRARNASFFRIRGPERMDDW